MQGLGNPHNSLQRQNSWDLPAPPQSIAASNSHPHHTPTNNHNSINNGNHTRMTGLPAHSQSSSAVPASVLMPPPPKPQEVARETEAQRQTREEQWVVRAVEVRAVRARLAQAYDRPNPEPARCLDQQGALIKEMRFLSLDFQQARWPVEHAVLLLLLLKANQRGSDGCPVQALFGCIAC